MTSTSFARPVIVTPYCGKGRATIERCIASVAAQTVAVDHILVADGHPQDWVAAVAATHLVLDRGHGDCGNAARGLGGLLAAARSPVAVANWVTMPRPLARIGDRVFAAGLAKRGYRTAHTGRPSIAYLSLWAPHCHAVGLPAPPGAKTLDIAPVEDWFASLPPRERGIAERLAGASITLRFAQPPITKGAGLARFAR